MKQESAKNNLLNIATDLVSGMLVGLVSGFYLDKWLGTKPLFIIICTIIGIAAGFRMVWREMRK
jgi:ATP synthase protein I